MLARESGLRAAGTRFARQEGALRRGGGTLRRRSPLALPSCATFGGDVRFAHVCPRGVAAAKWRESNKTRVLYNGGSMPAIASLSARKSPRLRYKTGVLYGSRFGCRRSNIVRRAGKMPCGAVSRPAGRVAVAQRRASAKLPDVVKQALRVAIFGFPQLFQHPPAPLSAGGTGDPVKRTKKELPRKRGSSFFSRTDPTNARPRKRGRLGRRIGLPYRCIL